jgi:RHS repeat-associated protein
LLDVTQLSSVTTTGISTESYSYDSEGRASSKTLTLTSRASYPFVTDYIYDTLDRITDVRYPAEYGNGTQPRKLVHHNYDVASRLTSLTVDGATHASQIVYNAASQTTQLKVGASGVNQISENYGYSVQTGLLDSQTVVRGGATTLLNLSYDYANANGKRTGQLTKILNNLNHNRDRGYAYDALGRLTQATGGQASAPLWTQTYSYDRFGNRTSVSASGYSAANRGSSPTVKEGLAANATAGGAGILPAMSALSAIAQPNDPQVSLPTEQLTARTDIASADSLRTGAPRSTSNSHHASRSTRPSAATPQGAPPPVFTDPDLLASGGIQIKALHITELRSAINALRARLGFSAYSWQTSASSGDLIKADPILEMRTALDQALGPPSAPGYSSGLAQYQPVLAIHIQELRNRVVAAWISSSAIPRDGLASASYDVTSNRITTAGFDYDKAGNQVRAPAPGGGSQRFQYDAANRLVKVKADDNVTVLATYTYGDSNERLIADEGGGRTYYDSEGGTVIAEYTESGGSTTPTWSKSYIYLGARLLSTLTPNGAGADFVQYHHPDRLGTRLVTNAQDTTYFEQVTLPFGTALNAESTGSTNRRFTSYDRSSATGLDYAVNRHYDPQQGRFTQVDPIGMNSVDLSRPQTLNLYAYCTNDPINQMDPSGLGFFSFLKKLFKWIAIAVAVALIVVATTSIGQPHVGIWATLKMFFQAGQLLAGAFGKGKLSIAFGIASGAAGLINALQNPDFTMHLFQVQGGVLNPGDVPGLTGPCPYGACAVTVFANYSRFEKILRGVGNWATGVADEVTTIPFTGTSFTKWYRHRQGWEGDADEDSKSYKAGGYTGVAFEITIEALVGEGEARAAGWGLEYLRYPNAGGGGINVYRLGVRRFALDWHRIKSVGPGKILHWHWGATKKAIKLHRGFWTGRPL